MADPKQDPPKQARGPLGDARPDAQRHDPRASPAQKPEPVEKRPGVGSVKPTDYPKEDRDKADLSGR
ncbi:MAG: hypothetical protein AB7E05_13680 [Sphingobium sp.]